MMRRSKIRPKESTNMLKYTENVSLLRAVVCSCSFGKPPKNYLNDSINRIKRHRQLRRNNNAKPRQLDDIEVIALYFYTFCTLQSHQAHTQPGSSWNERKGRERTQKVYIILCVTKRRETRKQQHPFFAVLIHISMQVRNFANWQISIDDCCCCVCVCFSAYNID